MRIRTIKPEFWANEKMSRMPDFTRLLAIGLLNYADDHGFFWANPLLIRGALFPFDEDSGKVRRSLAQLESEGFIQLGESSDGREAGHVVNFSKHQRVDKPRASEIKQLVSFDDHSEKSLGFILDESSQDRKGMEGIGKERNGKEEAVPASVVVIPDNLNTEAFRAAWANYLAYRTERHLAKLKPRSESLQLEKLAEWGHDAALISLKDTIRNGWQGIFAPKPNSISGNGGNQPIPPGGLPPKVVCQR